MPIRLMSLAFLFFVTPVGSSQWAEHAATFAPGDLAITDLFGLSGTDVTRVVPNGGTSTGFDLVDCAD